MKRSVITVFGPLLGLGAALLTACSGNGPGNLKVHEVSLFGGAQENIVWVYGTLGGSSSSSVKLSGSAVDVRAQVQDPLATPGSLSINGRATYRTATSAGVTKISLTRSRDGTFAVSTPNGSDVAAVYYTDGVTWSKLGGVSGTVTGSTVNGLRGAGQLTDAEADVLGRQLVAQAPLAVAVLNDPAPGLSVEPTPTESLRTSLYILPAVQTLAATTGTVMTIPNSGTQAVSGQPVAVQTTLVTGDPVKFTQLASGNNAVGAQAGVQVATTASAARDLYARAYGRQTPPNSAPSLGSNQTLVGVFAGQRSSGGYGVQVTAAHVKGNELTLTVNVNAPKPGSITTMSLTSPWTIVSVPGVFSSVKVVDASGRSNF